MNLLTQLTLGELLEFLFAFDERTLLIPSWSLPVTEGENKISFCKTKRGTVGSLRRAVVRVLSIPFQGVQHTCDSLIETRTGAFAGPMTIGHLLGSIKPWKGIGGDRQSRQNEPFNILLQINIEEMKRFLQCLKPELVLCPGFGEPHPYRGNISCLAFAPQVSITAGELVRHIEQAQTTFLVEHDGNPIYFKYIGTSPIFIADLGHYGTPMTFQSLLMAVENWIQLGEGFNRE
jgi:hypothetical protein